MFGKYQPAAINCLSAHAKPDIKGSLRIKSRSGNLVQTLESPWIQFRPSIRTALFEYPTVTSAIFKEQEDIFL